MKIEKFLGGEEMTFFLGKGGFGNEMKHGYSVVVCVGRCVRRQNPLSSLAVDCGIRDGYIVIINGCLLHVNVDCRIQIRLWNFFYKP